MDKERYIRRYETIIDNVEPVLYGRSPRGDLFNKELELFVFEIKRFSFFAHKNHFSTALHQKHIDDFINSMENMELEPHEETASTVYDYCARTYNLHVEPTIISVLSVYQNEFDFEEVHLKFQHLKEAYYKDYIGLQGHIRLRSRSKDYVLFKYNRRIFVGLCSYIYYSFFVVDDFRKTSLMLKSVLNHFDHFLLPQKDIIPNDILEKLSRLPKPFYQGLCYHFLQIDAITEALSYKLELSIISKDNDSFSKIINENNLVQFFSKYFELISLADDLHSTLNKRKFEPECFIRLISDYFDKLMPKSKAKGHYSRGICINTIGVFYDIKDNNVIPQDIYLKYPVKRTELYLVYLRFCKIKFPQISSNSTRMLSASSSETNSINTSPFEINNCQVDTTYEKELNCKFPDKIDDFIDYLVWKGFIALNDKKRFKNIVFGKDKSENCGVVKFNKANSGKTMLGVIVWGLRNDNSDLSNICKSFNVTIHLSNSYIGTNKDSQRIFVDMCLFFPSLINSLTVRDTNKKEVNRIIRENLKKRVKQLQGADEYINCLSILDFIKQLEVQDEQYWVVGKKTLD